MTSPTVVPPAGAAEPTPSAKQRRESRLTWADVFGVAGPAVCAVCKGAIQGNAFVFHDGAFYDPTCYGRRPAPEEEEQR